MKKLRLSPKSRNLFTLVDDDDYEALVAFNWFVNSGGYVFRLVRFSDVRQSILMHRVINKTPKGKETDHINRNKLDNRKSNLRMATRSENELNKNLGVRNTTGFKGVHLDKRCNRWFARITIDKKVISLGYFDNKTEAIVARQAAELRVKVLQ